MPAVAFAQETESEETTADEGDAQADQAPADDPEPELSAEEQDAEEETQQQAEAQESAEADAELATDLSEAEAETDASEDPHADSEEQGEQLPFRNSTFLWDHAVTTATLDPSAGRTWNPYYSWVFSLRPRWYFTDQFYIGLRQDLEYELTDSDTGAVNHRPLLADTRLDVGYSKFIEQDWFALSGTIRMTFPTSLASQGYEKVLAIGPTLSATATFPDVANGIEFGVGSTYAYTFATANTPRTSNIPYPRQTTGGEVEGDSTTDSFDNAASFVGRLEHAGTIALSVDFSPIERLGLSTSFTFWWQNGVDLDGDPVEVRCDSCAGGFYTDTTDRNQMRFSTWFTLGANYDVIDWLNLELYYSHLTREFGSADGVTGSLPRRNPFWSIDSQVGVTATLALDGLYTEIAGDTETEEEAPAVARGQSGRTAQ